MLPPIFLLFWGIAVEFTTSGKVERNAIDAVTAKCLIDNIGAFDQHALKKDDCLLKELVEWVPTSSAKPLGIVLISKKKVCSRCRRELVVAKTGHLISRSMIVTLDLFLGCTIIKHVQAKFAL